MGNGGGRKKTNFVLCVSLKIQKLVFFFFCSVLGFFLEKHSLSLHPFMNIKVFLLDMETRLGILYISEAHHMPLILKLMNNVCSRWGRVLFSYCRINFAATHQLSQKSPPLSNASG